jgi:hypothetical protein
MTLAHFGPFATVFEPKELRVPGHLVLLGLQDESEANVVVDRVVRAMEGDAVEPFVDRLLADPNWRPHLVAAVAFLVDDRGALNTSWLWDAMDRGSWVIPQLVVTALFVDKSFPERARGRVTQFCPVTVPAGLSPIERHSATGPDSTRARSAKMIASILEASALVPSLADWVASAKSQPEVIALLSADAYNDSPRIVDSWMTQARRVFEKRGIVLAPRVA